MVGTQGGNRSLYGQGSGFPGGSLGAQAPSLAQRVPMLSLDSPQDT